MGEIWVDGQGLEYPEHPRHHKKKFEVRVWKGPNDTLKKCVFVDDVKLDYSIDITQYWDACKMGLKKEAQESIIKHFCSAVSEMIGRKVNAEQIRKASEEGWI